MSQFAPFLHEPVFWKNGHTVPGGFGAALAAAFGLALGLALAVAPALPPPLPPPLPPFSGQGALPALGSQRLLAQLLVMGEGARVALRAVAVVAEVEADLARAAPFPPPLAPGPAVKVLSLAAAPEGLAAAALAAALSSRISFCAFARAAEGSEGSPGVVEYVECATAR